MAGATVTVANNGPVRISGEFVIKDAQGVSLMSLDGRASPSVAVGSRATSRFAMGPTIVLAFSPSVRRAHCHLHLHRRAARRLLSDCIRRSHRVGQASPPYIFCGERPPHPRGEEALQQ